MDHDVNNAGAHFRPDPFDALLTPRALPRQLTPAMIEMAAPTSGHEDTYVLRGSRILHAVTGGALGATAMAVPLGVIAGPFFAAKLAVVGVTIPAAVAALTGSAAAASPTPGPYWQRTHQQPTVGVLVGVLAVWAASSAESWYLDTASYRVEDAHGSSHRIFPSDVALLGIWAGVFAGVGALGAAALHGMARLTRRR